MVIGNPCLAAGRGRPLSRPDWRRDFSDLRMLIERGRRAFENSSVDSGRFFHGTCSIWPHDGRQSELPVFHADDARDTTKCAL